MTRARPSKSRAGAAASSSVTLTNALGLHLRAAAVFIKMANTFKAELVVERDGKRVNGKSIMGLMSLAAACGSTLKVSAKGKDASRAVSALVALIEKKFGEAR